MNNDLINSITKDPYDPGANSTEDMGDFMRDVKFTGKLTFSEISTSNFRLIGYMRSKDNDGASFWVSKSRTSYYTEPVYVAIDNSETTDATEAR